MWAGDEGTEEGSIIAVGGEVELGFINLGVRIANLLVAEDFLDRELKQKHKKEKDQKKRQGLFSVSSLCLIQSLLPVQLCLDTVVENLL